MKYFPRHLIYQANFIRFKYNDTKAIDYNIWARLVLDIEHCKYVP